jgi:hypothetical protein
MTEPNHEQDDQERPEDEERLVPEPRAGDELEAPREDFSTEPQGEPGCDHPHEDDGS